jgi:hypothetical protein
MISHKKEISLPIRWRMTWTHRHSIFYDFLSKRNIENELHNSQHFLCWNVRNWNLSECPIKSTQIKQEEELSEMKIFMSCPFLCTQKKAKSHKTYKKNSQSANVRQSHSTDVMREEERAIIYRRTSQCFTITLRYWNNYFFAATCRLAKIFILFLREK